MIRGVQELAEPPTRAREDADGRSASDARSDAEGRQRSTGDSFVPHLALPKGGGAIRGIGEKFAANAVTGTGSITVPIAMSPGRSGSPQLSLRYDSGAGNGPFGLGWSLDLPSIARRTDKGLPRYLDEQESDVFVLAGAEDLVPKLDVTTRKRAEPDRRRLAGTWYHVRSYQPRVEGVFALIERWTEEGTPASCFWRTVSRDNLTTWFGRSDESRIADPADPRRIFQWLVCQTNDDKGNVAIYRYRKEDSRGIAPGQACETNRTPTQRSANRYLKRIQYGNPPPGYLPTLDPTAPEVPLPSTWMFELVLDYGDHAGQAPTPQFTPEWPARADSFSSHRAGFEVRSYRLCRRALMFHHFPQDSQVGVDCLVRSTELVYREATRDDDPEAPRYSQLASVVQRAHERDGQGGYRSRQLPPLDLRYSEAHVDPALHVVDATDLENLPVGTQGLGYQWIDLDSEGLSGVLSEQGGAWFYKPNLGQARFGPVQLVARKPAMAALGGGRQHLMDLAGNGTLDLVDFGGPTPGFHERTSDGSWSGFVPFASLPNLDFNDPNVRLVDLTGDGHPDALLTEDDVLTWFPSLEERGFGAANRVPQAHDERAGPRVVFADRTQTVFLADMSGDGLTDLVRVRNGEVAYWPNLGYGRFGGKITLDNSPHFDSPDLYDPRRIRLADVDGSGPVDLLYLGRDGARIYFNGSGNRLSDPYRLAFPRATENLGAVQVADLLGNGTACLVWSSHLPADAARPAAYIDLMGSRKPNLLVGLDNNLGATTNVEYRPSTHFYLEDKAAGRPWVTRLPFPVHCVSRVSVTDQWRGSTFSTVYSYHHGYFDGPEREFRGFARVEQLDVEDFGTFAQGNTGSPYITDDQRLYQPPIKTITWYHTGAALDRRRILRQLESEFFPAGFTLAPGFNEKDLPEPELDPSLDTDEWREALRACKGMVLRQEIYELDVDDLSAPTPRQTAVRLFSAATHDCRIHCLQRRGENQHAVFLVTEGEAITYHYELALPPDRGAITPLEPDPRVAHTLNLRHDDQGNLQQSVAIVYGRRTDVTDPLIDGLLVAPDQQTLIRRVQTDEHISYAETLYTADVMKPSVLNDASSAVKHHRLRVPCGVQTFELTRIPKSGPRYFTLQDLRPLALSDEYPPQLAPNQTATTVGPLDYQEIANGPGPERRLVEHVRTLYFDDADGVSKPATNLPFRQHGPRGLKYEEYRLALTNALLDAVFTIPTVNNQTIDLLSREVAPATTARDWLTDHSRSGYVPGTQIDAALTDQLWTRSGIAGFESDAAHNFYLPRRYLDAFDNETLFEFDPLDLFLQSSRDHRGNVTQVASFDARVLQPRELVDANENHSEVAFDVLGRVIATAVKGKSTGPQSWEGDDLGGFDVTPALRDPADDDVRAFLTSAGFSETAARDWLGRASTRILYDLGAEPGPTAGSMAWARRGPAACAIRREVHASQADGGQSPLQIALEITDGGGNVFMKKAQAEPAPGQTARRWIVNGLTVVNNKGKPVKQYEPDFTSSFGWEPPPANGVTSVLYYDAAGRLVRTELPDGTFSRVELTPWRTRNYDQNDTVLASAWYAARGPDLDGLHPRANGPPPGSPPSTTRPRRSPSWTAWAETVVGIAHNRTPNANGQWQDEHHLTFTKLDAEGKPLWIRDPRGNLVIQHVTPPKPTRWVDQPHEAVPAGSVPAYDVAGNLLFQHGMDAGDRWMLNDAAGKPMVAWDVNTTLSGNILVSEERVYLTEYDGLHRPTAQWLAVSGGARQMVERFEYHDTDDPDPAGEGLGNNLRGQLVRQYDPSGSHETVARDFKGAVTEERRRLNNLPLASLIDWQTNPETSLEAETFGQETEHDALGRMTRLYAWRRLSRDRVTVYEPHYGRRGLLERETVIVGATRIAAGYRTDNGAISADAIQEIRRDAKGQRTFLALGNGTLTQYEYDPLTFRVRQIQTTRPADAIGFPQRRSNLADASIVQQLLYTYDPVGNVAEVEDQAYEPVFFRNQMVEPRGTYTYDALYRLIEAEGRESYQPPSAPVHREGLPPSVTFQVTTQTLRNYTQSYTYDGAGNLLSMRHHADQGDWHRRFEVALDSNLLVHTWEGADLYTDPTATNKTAYSADAHGNMLNLASVAPDMFLHWDHRDMIDRLDLEGGGWAYYQYDATKQRTRKRLERLGGTVEERIYLGGYELYRRFRASDPTQVVEEIESFHLFDGQARVLMIDDVLTPNGPGDPRPDGLTVPAQTLFRYQYANHLGSASLELDDQQRIISYEEHHPYGTSAFRLRRDGSEAPPKRYRYTGMERDEESGLNYHSARYYAPWLATWSAPDSALSALPTSRYRYAQGNPVRFVDTDGRQPMVAPVAPTADTPRSQDKWSLEYYTQMFEPGTPSELLTKYRDYRDVQLPQMKAKWDKKAEILGAHWDKLLERGDLPAAGEGAPRDAYRDSYIEARIGSRPENVAWTLIKKYAPALLMLKMPAGPATTPESLAAARYKSQTVIWRETVPVSTLGNLPEGFSITQAEAQLLSRDIVEGSPILQELKAAVAAGRAQDQYHDVFRLLEKYLEQERLTLRFVDQGGVGFRNLASVRKEFGSVLVDISVLEDPATFANEVVHEVGAIETAKFMRRELGIGRSELIPSPRVRDTPRYWLNHYVDEEVRAGRDLGGEAATEGDW